MRRALEMFFWYKVENLGEQRVCCGERKQGMNLLIIV